MMSSSCATTHYGVQQQQHRQHHGAAHSSCRRVSVATRPLLLSGRRRLALPVAAAAAATPPPFAALGLAQPSAAAPVLQRQVVGAAASDLDNSFFSASPFSTMRRFDDMLFQEMEAFGRSSGSAVGGGGPFSRMQQQMADMDRQLDKAFADMDRVERELDAQLARNLRKLQEQQPGVRIERREERQPGSYRYFESIQIRSGGMSVLTPATTHAPAGLASPLLVLAVVLAGAYAAVTAAFARNFSLTTYGERSRWQLLALWPVLALLNKPFREQFSAAMRGERVRVRQPELLPDSEKGGGSSVSKQQQQQQ